MNRTWRWRGLPAVFKITGQCFGSNDDENVGIDILKKTLEEPLKRNLINAGLESSEIVQKVKSVENGFG